MRINILIDNHLPVDLESYPLPDLDRTALRRFLADIRPHRLTAFAYGHDGWAQYPSALNESPPSMPIDLVDLWRELASETGCMFAIYVSTLINHRLLRKEPTWERTGLENNPTRRLDHTSPFLDAWLKPVLIELIERYHPQGFFFDGDYWTVGESLSAIRVPAARRLFAHFEGDLSSLTRDEHRHLTIQTYRAYLADLAAFLLPRAPKSCVNLAFSFRHPVERPPGLGLTTSDLPPFFAVLDCWFETAVLQSGEGEREVLVPLFVEPEGGGRKYTKTLQQVVQEIAPIIAMNEALHVYFPMNVQGRLDTSFLSLLKAVKYEVARIAPNAFEGHFKFDPDVICLADAETLECSQDFAQLRGAALLAALAGMNFCIANPAQCKDILSTQLLLAPLRLSDSAQNCVNEARARGVQVLQDDYTDSNRMVERLKLEALKQKYLDRSQSWFSEFTIQRPPCAFIRGFRDDLVRWRIFIFNSSELGSDLGRHVISNGAAFAGRIKIGLPPRHECNQVEGYVEDICIEHDQVAFDLVGAFAIVEGRSST